MPLLCLWPTVLLINYFCKPELLCCECHFASMAYRIRKKLKIVGSKYFFLHATEALCRLLPRVISQMSLQF